jgi:23S rRNA (cytosine1962-C5)-methyltransferase
MAHEIPGYELIDSGNGRKLERFGELAIDRPSSLSAWTQRKPPHVWAQAAASYNHPDSWRLHSKRFSTWKASITGITLELELLSNGQLGIFPEHALYVPLLRETIRNLSQASQRQIRVLNLFAYTGLATMACAMQPNCFVTHVDLAKKAVEWAKRNAILNDIRSDAVRWIVDDALSFMAREARKEARYDIIIIDPPSFSRISKNNSWTLEEKTPEIVELMLNVLNPDVGAIFFSNHSLASITDITRNITLDKFKDSAVRIEGRPLSLKEADSPRMLPASSLITIERG